MNTRAKNRPNRTNTRIPVGGRRDILTVEGKDPNFKYSWVNDDRGLIDKFLNGGYEIVEHDATVGQREIDSSKGVQKAVTKNVGGGITAYLMRIPNELYEEDMREKAKRINRSEEDIRRTLNSGQNGSYGKVEIS